MSGKMKKEKPDEEKIVAQPETMEIEADPGAVSDEIEEIQEFVVSSARERFDRKKAEQASVSAIAGWDSRKKSIALLVLFAVLALGYILIGMFALQVAPVAVCVTLLVQVAIGVLLDQNPVWLHACVVAADIVVGICISQILLLLLAAVIYVAAIVILELLQRMGMVARAEGAIH